MIFQLKPVLVAVTLRYLPLLPIIDVHRNHLADNFINSDSEISQSNRILVKWSLIADAGAWLVLIFMFCWWWTGGGIARIRLFNCENFGEYELTLILTEACH